MFKKPASCAVPCVIVSPFPSDLTFVYLAIPPSLVLATTQSLTSLLQVYQVFNMVKELITVEMERDSLQQKWGFTVQGGKDVSLTAKIASVKVRKGGSVTQTQPRK